MAPNPYKISIESLSITIMFPSRNPQIKRSLTICKSIIPSVSSLLINLFSIFLKSSKFTLLSAQPNTKISLLFLFIVFKLPPPIYLYNIYCSLLKSNKDMDPSFKPPLATRLLWSVSINSILPIPPLWINNLLIFFYLLISQVAITPFLSHDTKSEFLCLKSKTAFLWGPTKIPVDFYVFIFVPFKFQSHKVQS